MTELKPLALPPETRSSGDFKRVITLHMRDHFQGMYTVPLPVWSQADGLRTSHQMQTLPIHEVVQQELSDLDVHALSAAYEPPPNYSDNRLVKEFAAKGQVVAPLSLFMDGVAYGKKNSVLVISVQNLWTGKRQIVCGVRKRLLCQCGCRGFCTLFCVFQWVGWSLEHMAQGRFPAHRHDKQPWGPQDQTRQEEGAKVMTCPAVVIQLRADWSEFMKVIAVPSWSSKKHPCFLCFTKKRQMAEHLGEGDGQSFPWRLKKWIDYEKACSQCEIEVQGLSYAQWSAMLGLLYNDKDSGGRAIGAAWPALKLEKGDRIEPTDAVPDWAMITEKHIPDLLFWRPSLETVCKHRVPMFSELWTFTPEQCCALDVMHTWCLGIHAQFVGHAFWQFVLHNTDNLQVVSRKASEKQAGNLALMRASLEQWYQAAQDTGSPANVSRVGELTLLSLGPRASPFMKTKAHQTLTLLRWLHQETRGWEDSIPLGAEYALACSSLLKMWSLLDESPMVVPPQTLQDGDMSCWAVN